MSPAGGDPIRRAALELALHAPAPSPLTVSRATMAVTMTSANSFGTPHV